MSGASPNIKHTRPKAPLQHAQQDRALLRAHSRLGQQCSNMQETARRRADGKRGPLAPGLPSCRHSSCWLVNTPPWQRAGSRSASGSFGAHVSTPLVVDGQGLSPRQQQPMANVRRVMGQWLAATRLHKWLGSTMYSVAQAAKGSSSRLSIADPPHTHTPRRVSSNCTCKPWACAAGSSCWHAPTQYQPAHRASLPALPSAGEEPLDPQQAVM